MVSGLGLVVGHLRVEVVDHGIAPLSSDRRRIIETFAEVRAPLVLTVDNDKLVLCDLAPPGEFIECGIALFQGQTLLWWEPQPITAAHNEWIRLPRKIRLELT